MITASAPYPEVGSDALLIDAGKTEPVRIIGRDGRYGRLVAFHNRAGASGNKRVALSELLDPSPLSPKEEAEYRRLESDLVGKARPNRKTLACFDALRLRSIHAETLDALKRRAR